MNFADLPVFAKFRFWRRGTLLTKTSKSAYTAPSTGLEEKAAPDAEVLPEDDEAVPSIPIAPKVDDVALISKALDELEAFHGEAGVADARQALRRLAAAARLKTGGRG